MTDQSGTRSVKIGADERTGWSSDRPRRGNAPERKPDISVRGRVLEPTFRLRYTPGSLVLVAAPDRAAAEQYMHTVLEDRARAAVHRPRRAAAQGPGRGRWPRSPPSLEAAVMKRLNGGDAVVLILDSLDAEERERWLREAAALRRPRHLVLLDGSGGDDADREALGDLRKALMANALGEEGFHTSIRLGGKAAGDVKRIVFRPPPARRRLARAPAGGGRRSPRCCAPRSSSACRRRDSALVSKRRPSTTMKAWPALA